MTGVATTESGTEGLNPLVQDLAAYLYVDYGLVTSPRTERLQRSFDVLTDLFDRVDLRKN